MVHLLVVDVRDTQMSMSRTALHLALHREEDEAEVHLLSVAEDVAVSHRVDRLVMAVRQFSNPTILFHHLPT